MLLFYRDNLDHCASVFKGLAQAVKGGAKAHCLDR